MSSAIFKKYSKHRLKTTTRLRFQTLSIQAESTETKIKPLFVRNENNIININQI